MSVRNLLATAPRSARRFAAAGVLGLLLVGVVAVAAGGQTSSGDYRTSTATLTSVDQVLHAVATIEPVAQATVAFPIAGTVEAVDVSVGDEVRVGTALAELDTASLQRTLRQQQAALDQAQLNLERALNGEAVGGADPTGVGATPASFSSDTTGEPETVDLGEVETVAVQTGPSDADIAAAQQALLAAQQQADAALAAVQPAIDNATSICAAVGSADQAGFPAALTACTDAITAVATAQHAAQTAQAAVSSAAATLDDLLDQRAAALAEQPPTTTQPAQPTEPAQPSPSTGGVSPEAGSLPSAGGATGGGSSVSSERLIALQRAVDAAALEVIVAQQAVAQAAIVSPIRGTVIAVNLAVGEGVDAASTTANIVVAGRGGYEATVSVSVEDLADLEVGEAATVRPDSGEEELDGEVVAIGVAANAGSFPVTIGLNGDTSGLGNGSTSSVDITTDAADDVLAVPTSAITVDGDTATVQVPDGDQTRAVTVEIGAIGATWTEVTSGLEEGDTVVLADLDEALPGSATDTSGSNTTFGPGDFGGGPFTLPGG